MPEQCPPNPAHTLQQVLLETLSAAAAQRGTDDDETIHKARRRLKEARAVLRLLRPALGGRLYRFANHDMRDAAKPLRAARDAAAMLSTLESVDARKPDDRARAAIAQLREQLLLNLRSEREALSHRRREAGGARLEPLVELLRNLQPRPIDTSIAPSGLAKVYRQGRSAYRAARRHPTTTALHEWRKQVNYLHNELKLLHGLYGLGLRKTRRRSGQLAALLGDDHDLATLRAKLRQIDPQRRLSATVLRQISGSRQELQGRALDLGKRLYSAPTGRFAGRARRSVRRHLPD